MKIKDLDMKIAKISIKTSFLSQNTEGCRHRPAIFYTPQYLSIFILKKQILRVFKFQKNATYVTHYAAILLDNSRR